MAAVVITPTAALVAIAVAAVSVRESVAILLSSSILAALEFRNSSELARTLLFV
jgi:hypothetical protein